MRRLAEAGPATILVEQIPGPGLLAMMVIVPLIFLLPFGNIPTGLLGGISATKLIVPTAFLVMLALARHSFVIHPSTVTLLAFVLLTLPSLILSTSFMPVFLSLVGYLILTNLMINATPSFREFEWICRTYLIATVAVAIFTLLAVVGIFDLGGYLGHTLIDDSWIGVPLVRGTEDSTTGFAPYFVPAVPLALCYLINVRGKWKKLALALCLVVLCAMLLITVARGATVAAFVGCLIMLFFSVSRASLIRVVTIGGPLIVGFLLFAPVLVLYFLTGSMDVRAGEAGFQLLSDKTASTEIHGAVLNAALQLLLVTPPWGWGEGNTNGLIENITGYYLNAHNVYLGIALEFGIPAALVFLGYCAYACRSGYIAASAEADPRRRSLYGAVLGCVVGLLINGLSHEDYVNSMIWCFFGLVFASPGIASLRPGDACIGSAGSTGRAR